MTSGSTITVTVAVVLLYPAALAVIVALPDATPVTGTETLVTFSGRAIGADTVTALELLELNATLTYEGVGGEKVKMRFRVPAPIVVLAGENLMFPNPTVPTCTVAMLST
jgi:hypothetical protein